MHAASTKLIKVRTSSEWYYKFRDKKAFNIPSRHFPSRYLPSQQLSTKSKSFHLLNSDSILKGLYIYTADSYPIEEDRNDGKIKVIQRRWC